LERLHGTQKVITKGLKVTVGIKKKRISFFPEACPYFHTKVMCYARTTLDEDKFNMREREYELVMRIVGGVQGT
jgi:hypothetical protein